MLITPLCWECKHYETGHSRPNGCAAFPFGIPPEILVSDFDHNLPHPEDNGIQFEPSEVAAPTPAAK